MTVERYLQYSNIYTAKAPVKNKLLTALVLIFTTLIEFKNWEANLSGILPIRSTPSLVYSTDSNEEHC